MKKTSLAATFILWMGFLGGRWLAAQDSPKAPEASAIKPQTSSSTPEFKNDNAKISYALGMRLALELKTLRNAVDVDPEMVTQGLRDSLTGAKTRLTDDQRVEVLSQLQRNITAKEEQVRQQMAETNAKGGEAFLAANKGKEGVVTLPSGLQYKVLMQGTGPKPALDDTVVCNYRGNFIDGKEFDSSYKRGQPSSFPVVGVIKGWTEALQLMPVGSKWQLFVPSKLAYGESGHRPNIEPNATLIFEVELISIQPKEKPPAK
jgi:FKBP-type peptidyl-prolyl cis-trans isomerase